MYVRKFPNGKFVILLLYVDDMLIVGQNAGVIGNLKKDLFKSFDMTWVQQDKFWVCKICVIGKLRSYGYHKRSILSRFLKGSI